MSPRTSPRDVSRNSAWDRYRNENILEEYSLPFFLFFFLSREIGSKDISFPLFSNFAPLRMKERSYFFYLYIYILQNANII